MIKKIIIIFFLGLISLSNDIYGAELSFEGWDHKPVYVEMEKNTGLDALYVAYSITKDFKVTFKDSSVKNGSVKWYRYSNLGGGYAEELSESGITTIDGASTLGNPEGDMGYIVEYTDKKYYFWLSDYSAHGASLSGISIPEEQPCESTDLLLTMTGEPIKYFTINGQQRTVNQEYEITFYTLEASMHEEDESENFYQVESSYIFPSPTKEVNITPPVYCSTYFHLQGDRFLKEWGMEESAESSLFTPNAVAVITRAIQDYSEVPEEGSNQIHNNSEDMGGSAPVTITFEAIVTDAVIHHEWQMSSDPEFEVLDYRFNQQDLEYTFTEEGTFYLRYVGSNADGSCEAYGDIYTVSIGASEIKCPNAFSPGTSPGVNDEWKVSYRSILKFECWIFNRYGTQVCHFSDPNQGWDGKYKGKYVKPGVYYYVIEAEGADGKKYKLSGDINIIGYKGRGASSSGEDSGAVTE